MSDMNVVGLAADIALSAGFTSIDLTKYGKAFPVVVHVDSRTPFAKRLPKGQSVVRWDVRPKLSLRDPEQLVPFLRTLGEDVSLAPRIDMDLFLFTKRVPKLSSSPSTLKPSSKPPSSSLTEHPGAIGGTKSKSSPSLGPAGTVVLHDDVAIDSHDTVEAIGLREGDQIDLTLDVIAVQKKRKQLEGSSDMQKLGSKSGGGSGVVGNSSFGDRRRRNSSPRTVHQKSPSLSFRGVDAIGGMGSSITSTPPAKVTRSPNATNVSFTLPPAIRDVAESTNSAPSAAVPGYQGVGNSPLRNVLAQNNVKPASFSAAAAPPKAAPSTTEREDDYGADDYGQTPMPYQSMNPNEPLKQTKQLQQQPWSGSPYNERDNAGYSRGMPSNGTSHHFLFDELPSSTEQQPNILNASSHDTTTITGQQQQQLPQVMELMRMAHHNRRAILDEFYDALDNQDPDHFDFDEDGNPVVLLPNVEEYLMELDNEELELELREISENLQEFVQRQLQVLTDDAASTAALRRPASSSVVDDVRVQNAMDQLIVYVCRRNRLRAAHEEERIFERELLRKKLHSIRTASSRSVSREHHEGVACRRPPGDDKNERFTVTSTGERLDRAYLPSVLEML